MALELHLKKLCKRNIHRYTNEAILYDDKAETEKITFYEKCPITIVVSRFRALYKKQRRQISGLQLSAESKRIIECHKFVPSAIKTNVKHEIINMLPTPCTTIIVQCVVRYRW